MAKFYGLDNIGLFIRKIWFLLDSWLSFYVNKENILSNFYGTMAGLFLVKVLPLMKEQVKEIKIDYILLLLVTWNSKVGHPVFKCVFYFSYSHRGFKEALNTLLCRRVHENQCELRTNLNMICLIFLKPLPTGKKKSSGFGTSQG